MAGEYSPAWRPHYHIIIFGYDFPDKQRTLPGDIGQDYYISPQCTRLWPQGNHIITDANFDTAAYCARYITKKITGPLAEDHYRRTIIDVDEVTGEIYFMGDTVLEPEYARMSRGRKSLGQSGSGIGAGWYEKYKSDCYPSDFLIKDGKKIPVPKYYDKLLELEEPFKLAQIKQERENRAILNAAETTPERLDQRLRCKLAQQKTLRRDKI